MIQLLGAEVILTGIHAEVAQDSWSVDLYVAVYARRGSVSATNCYCAQPLTKRSSAESSVGTGKSFRNVAQSSIEYRDIAG